ncbi:hypothetical protein AK812_SmicGene22016 [Symbiodinium microadriaticum]|uniref:EF-hand domain-containing protein n=1 Tax=Symbiodinium microadriaticum TaxID=2951 RepID=A0A1Q9DKX3_SYMMI|nr:hypothetical protein AK812_SmicGene22016 [Symbiodinium microadriaticum]
MVTTTTSKGIGEAEELRVLLEEEGERRQEVLQNAIAISAERGRSLRDLHVAITAAREASVTPEFLAEPYARLRKKKLDFVTSALRSGDVPTLLLAFGSALLNACATGKYSLAFALYHRGLALKAFEERNGGEWRSGAIQAEIKRLRADVSTIHGTTDAKGVGTCLQHSVPASQGPLWPITKSERVNATIVFTGIRVRVRLSVALAEASDSPATMAVHVVRNNKEVHEAGAGYMLMPGYDVLASSHDHGGKGELGPFTLIVNATESVDVIRIPPANCEPQRFQESFEVKNGHIKSAWAVAGSEVELRWFRGRSYRNPQFRVKLKQSEDAFAALFPRLSRPESLGPLVPAPRPNTAPTTPASAEKMDLKKLRMIFDSADVQGNGMVSVEIAFLHLGTVTASIIAITTIIAIIIIIIIIIILTLSASPSAEASSPAVNKRELVKGLRRDAKMAEFFGLPSEIRQEDGSRDQMEALFQAMDSDSDREITWEEFVAFQVRFTHDSANADGKQFGMAFDFWLLQAGPAAVHILRNLEGMGKVLAQSGLRHTGREYSSASEAAQESKNATYGATVGAVLRLPQDRPEDYGAVDTSFDVEAQGTLKWSASSEIEDAEKGGKGNGKEVCE